MNIIYLVLFLVTHVKLAYLCPPEDILYPFSCKNNELHFSGNFHINTTDTSIVISNWLELNNLSKVFKSLNITNTAIKFLEEYSFYDLTFKGISIKGAVNLEIIHKDVFKYSNKSITYLELIGTHNLENTAIINFFDIANSFINLNELMIADTNINVIPSYAFKNPALRTIFLRDIETISDYSFYNSSNIELFGFQGNFTKIPSHALEFANMNSNISLNKQLTIQFLEKCLINDNSFSVGALDNVNRNIFLNFLHCQELLYLDENVYKNFLNNTMSWIIFFGKSNLDCDNCNNKWIIKRINEYSEKISNATCSNKKTFSKLTFQDVPHCINITDVNDLLGYSIQNTNVDSVKSDLLIATIEFLQNLKPFIDNNITEHVETSENLRLVNNTINLLSNLIDLKMEWNALVFEKQSEIAVEIIYYTTYIATTLVSNGNISSNLKFRSHKNIILEIFNYNFSESFIFEANGTSIFIPQRFLTEQNIIIKNNFYIALINGINEYLTNGIEMYEQINSDIIILDLISQNKTTVINNIDKIKISFSHKNQLKLGDKTSCVYWDINKKIWSYNGCKLLSLESNRQQTTCECQTLGIYALVLNKSGRQYIILSLIILCVVMIFVIILFFISLKYRNKLLIEKMKNEFLKILIDKHLYINSSLISIAEDIGEGHFGYVYKAIIKDELKEVNEVALKKLKKGIKKKYVESFFKEALILSEYKHKYVLKTIGVSFDKNGYPMIIIPLMANGDLLSYLRNGQNLLFVKQLLKFSQQVAEGMKFLSNIRYVHRDLAARNILLDEVLNAKISDFGLSRNLYTKQYYRSKNKIPLPLKWMAIESIESGLYSTATDIWSYGVLFWEILNRGSEPYPSIENKNVLAHIKSGKRLTKPEFCSEAIYDLLIECWSVLPEKRPDFTEITEFLNNTIDSTPESNQDGCYSCSNTEYIIPSMILNI